MAAVRASRSPAATPVIARADARRDRQRLARRRIRTAARDVVVAVPGRAARRSVLRGVRAAPARRRSTTSRVADRADGGAPGRSRRDDLARAAAGRAVVDRRRRRRRGIATCCAARLPDAASSTLPMPLAAAAARLAAARIRSAPRRRTRSGRSTSAGPTPSSRANARGGRRAPPDRHRRSRSSAAADAGRSRGRRGAAAPDVHQPLGRRGDPLGAREHRRRAAVRRARRRGRAGRATARAGWSSTSCTSTASPSTPRGGGRASPGALLDRVMRDAVAAGARGATLEVRRSNEAARGAVRGPGVPRRRRAPRLLPGSARRRARFCGTGSCRGVASRQTAEHRRYGRGRNACGRVRRSSAPLSCRERSPVEAGTGARDEQRRRSMADAQLRLKTT